MKYISIQIPHELSNKREFTAVIYSKSTNHNDYKNVSIELDEDDEKVISYSCTCKANTIRDSMNKSQMKCKHIQDFEKVIKRLGYLKEEIGFTFTNQKI